MGEPKISIDELAVFCKKKGFAVISGEIYGGLSGFYDFGWLGSEMKRNIKDSLWNDFVRRRGNIVGIDGSIITHPKVWEASGHVENFSDMIVSCGKCRESFRADQVAADQLGVNPASLSIEDVKVMVEREELKCPHCGSILKTASKFNLMFSTKIGSTAGNGVNSFLRPETAQLIFTDFKGVMDSARMRPPFGIAQLGKAFRNEISPRDFLFRMREFEQFEIEFFTADKDEGNDDEPDMSGFKGMKINLLTEDRQRKKGGEAERVDALSLLKTAKKWHAYWLLEFYSWFIRHGISPANLRIREHRKEELAHYASACFDIEYKFPFGWSEIHGDAERGSFDLDQHSKYSGQKMYYFDAQNNEKIVPRVAAEPSQGIERAMMAFLYDAYKYDKERGNVVMGFHPVIAPVKVGVFPLVNKLDEKASAVFRLVNENFVAVYDRSGSIGRRYARADEIGIPFCITIDFDTLKDESVTIRERDTTKQTRVKISEIAGYLKQRGL